MPQKEPRKIPLKCVENQIFPLRSRVNYAFIILGDEIGYDPDEKNIIIRAENYFDQNGKKTAEYEELKEYIQHIYYVLMTRGIRGTYLYVSDPNLRDYISRYVDVE